MLSIGLCVASAMAAIGSWHARGAGGEFAQTPAGTQVVEAHWSFGPARSAIRTTGGPLT